MKLLNFIYFHSVRSSEFHCVKYCTVDKDGSKDRTAWLKVRSPTALCLHHSSPGHRTSSLASFSFKIEIIAIPQGESLCEYSSNHEHKSLIRNVAVGKCLKLLTIALKIWLLCFRGSHHFIKLFIHDLTYHIQR